LLQNYGRRLLAAAGEQNTGGVGGAIEGKM